MARSVSQFRIFLSSPGDVGEERRIARDVVEKVLSKNPFIRDRATFDVKAWDDPDSAYPLQADCHPQESLIRSGLPLPGDCDVVIVIFWSRMGSPLPKHHLKPDGTPYRSGTEWEFEDALRGKRENVDNGKPALLLYRCTKTPSILVDDPEFEEKREQYQKVHDFFTKSKDKEGALVRGILDYNTADAFKDLLTQHLYHIAFELLGDGIGGELGVTKAAVETMLAVLREQPVPPDQLEAKLKQFAERHLELTERLHALSKSNDEPAITERRERAAEAIEQGDYDLADTLLGEAVAIDRRGIDEQQEELDRRKLSVAATIGQQGELERTRLNYRKAAEHFAEAARSVPASETETRLGYQMEQASTLDDLGREFGDNQALVEAIDSYRRILEERTRERVPLDWAMTQNNLGNALWTLGERESGTASLEAAVDAYRAALEERTRERVPLDWAMTQNNLGNALQTLGERESGTARLETAVDAYRAALEVRTRERVPLKWAMTQNNLGLALQTLDQRGSGAAGLEAAVDAFRAALEERTRERVPLDWAMTQNNLGLALQALGEREGSTARLETAVDAYRAALEERTRERVPLQWATTQHNLGNALKTLGERTGKKGQLQAALKAMTDASDVVLNEAQQVQHEAYFQELIEAIEAAIKRMP